MALFTIFANERSFKKKSKHTSLDSYVVGVLKKFKELSKIT
jgi:hypothetical protein